MRVLIVFESLFGNTRQIAEAIAEGARRASMLVDASCIRVPDLVGAETASADLFFVGGPTQFHGMASRKKRGVWLRQQDLETGASRSGHALEPGTGGSTLSEWLDRILSGGAAPKIERRLRDRGYTIAAAPVGFIVEDMEGPLRSGERERAAAWGQMAVERLL